MKYIFSAILLISLALPAQTSKTEVIFLSHDYKMTFPCEPKISSEDILSEKNEKRGVRDRYMCDDVTSASMIKVEDATFTPAGLEHFKKKGGDFFKDTQAKIEKAMYEPENVKVTEKKKTKVGRFAAYRFGGSSKDTRIETLLIQKNSGITMIIEMTKTKSKDTYLKTLQATK